MGESDDIQKIKDGDFVAFEDWMDNHYHNIERFAFQNGCTQEQAAHIAEDTFREIYNEPGNLDFQMRTIYKMVLEKIAILEPTIPLLEDVFRFEEDAELHSAIIYLDEKYRVPFVLQVFHGMDNEQVASYTGLSISEVLTRVQVARNLLSQALDEPSTKRLEKRFELLGKSYDRLPILFNMENVWKPEISVSDPIVNNRKKQGWTGWLLAIALGLLLMSLVGSTYFTGEDNELRSDRKYIEGLEKEFAKLATDKQAILGVSDAFFNRITYFRSIREHFKGLMTELKDKNQEGVRIDRQLAEDWLLEMTEAMKLPSEHADELFAAPLVHDVGQSMMFADVYFMKVDAVRYSLYELYGNDYDRLRESLRTGTFDAEDIIALQDGYSQNTIEVIKALTSQNIELLLPEEALKDNEFVSQLRAALHESVGSRLTQYEREPFMLYDQLLYSLDDTIGFIKEMEQTISGTKQIQWFGLSMEGTMINLLEAIVQGKTIEEFQNSDGSISEVHRDAWRELASLGSDSGVGVIMTKIVEEMEASNWQYSEFHSSLKDYRIYEAYSLASRDELEQFWLKPFEESYNEMAFGLPNNNYLDKEVPALYDEFSIAYDRTVLANVHPLFIVGLFYYANDKGDSAMMWHLTDPVSRTSSIEEYTAKEIALLEITDTIRFNSALVMTNGGKTTAPIEFERNGKMYYNVWMTYATDQVWQIDSIVIEEGSL